MKPKKPKGPTQDPSMSKGTPKKVKFPQAPAPPKIKGPVPRPQVIP